MAKRKKSNERPVILPEEKADDAPGGDDPKIENAQTGEPVPDELTGTGESVPEATDDPVDPVTASEEILKNLEDYKEALADEMPEMQPKKTRGRRKKDEPDKSAVIIPPELFVFVCDYGTASGFVLIDKFITKNPKKRVKTEQLGLRPEQAEKMYPLAEKAIEAMKLSDDPIRAFFGSLLAVQFTNYVLWKSTQE